MWEFLQMLVPVGLAMDLVGFLSVVRYGHSLFIWAGSGPPDSGQGKDGDIFLRTASEGGSGQASGQTNRHRRFAFAGVAAVTVGFALQIIGAIAALHYS